jgi:hypothetical protein
MSLLAGYGLSGGSPPGIREEIAVQEARIRLALDVRPPAPLSASLSGYRELNNRELARAPTILSQEDIVLRTAA